MHFLLAVLSKMKRTQKELSDYQKFSCNSHQKQALTQESSRIYKVLEAGIDKPFGCFYTRIFQTSRDIVTLK